MSEILIFFIRQYKRWISPLLGNRCRFTPSCSEYAMEAIRVHGAFKGIILGGWRILRCNPLGKYGYDPVPEKGRWKNEDRRLYREKHGADKR